MDRPPFRPAVCTTDHLLSRPRLLTTVGQRTPYPHTLLTTYRDKLSHTLLDPSKPDNAAHDAVGPHTTLLLSA